MYNNNNNQQQQQQQWQQQQQYGYGQQPPPPQYNYQQQGYGQQPPPQQHYSYPPQQQYAPNPGKHSHQASAGGSSNGTYGDTPQSSSVKINQKPKYNDVWATILFLIVLVSYGVLAYFGELSP
jgi:hypothetical protein